LSLATLARFLLVTPSIEPLRLLPLALVGGAAVPLALALHVVSLGRLPPRRAQAAARPAGGPTSARQRDPLRGIRRPAGADAGAGAGGGMRARGGGGGAAADGPHGAPGPFPRRHRHPLLAERRRSPAAAGARRGRGPPPLGCGAPLPGAARARRDHGPAQRLR